MSKDRFDLENDIMNVWTESPKKNNMFGIIKCVITLDDIQNDSEVCKCDICSALCLFDAMNEWLSINPTKICPHCRSPWTNYNKIDFFI